MRGQSARGSNLHGALPVPFYLGSSMNCGYCDTNTELDKCPNCGGPTKPLIIATNVADRAWERGYANAGWKKKDKKVDEKLLPLWLYIIFTPMIILLALGIPVSLMYWLSISLFLIIGTVGWFFNLGTGAWQVLSPILSSSSPLFILRWVALLITLVIILVIGVFLEKLNMGRRC